MKGEIETVQAIVSKLEAMKNGGEVLTPAEQDQLTALFQKGAAVTQEMSNQLSLF